MSDLLTTKQVQTMLRVDRTTIYRMVEAGQLPAVRVGKQWRFNRPDVERWLHGGQMAARTNGAASPATAAHQAPPLVEQPNGAADIAELLPANCAQAVQDAFAEMLGVTMVITDMAGRPVTGISNPCGFVAALLAGKGDGIEHCVHTWQQMAGIVALEPKFAPSEMGLLCARGLIRVGVALKGMVVIGGIAPESWPPSPEQSAELAAMFGVDPETIRANCGAVFQMDAGAQERALRYVQRIADVFSLMVQDRLAAANRLAAC